MIVLDASASTEQASDAGPLFNPLRDGAGRVIDAIQAGDRAGLIVMGGDDTMPPPRRLTRNPEVLREVIADARPTAARGDPAAALAAARRLLADAPPPRRLVLVSDLQATTWREAAAALPTRGGLPGGTRITLLTPPRPARPNVTLHAPAARPPSPSVGEPVTLTARLTLRGDQPRDVPMRIAIEGQPERLRRVELQPDELREVSVVTTFDQPGERRVVWSIPRGDALSVDDTARLVVRVRVRPTVLVLGDDAADDPDSDRYVLARALAPRGGEGDRLDVVLRTPGEALPRDVLGASVVVVARVERWPSMLEEAVSERLRRGGGVLWLLGPTGDADALTATLAAAGSEGGERSSFQIGGVAGADSQPVRIAAEAWDEAAFAGFDGASREALADVTIARHRVVNATPAERVLLRLTDGTPALVEASTPGGRLLVATFGLGRGESELSTSGVFIAVLHRLVERLRDGEAAGVFTTSVAGEAVTIPLDQPLDPAGPLPVVVSPRGGAVRAGDVEASPTRGVVTLRRADEAGFYRVMQGDRVVATAGVNVDEREGDLRRLNAEQLTAALTAGGGSAQGGDQTTTPDAAGDARNRRPLWGWALAAALALLAMEAGVAARRRA